MVDFSNNESQKPIRSYTSNSFVSSPLCKTIYAEIQLLIFSFRFTSEPVTQSHFLSTREAVRKVETI